MNHTFNELLKNGGCDCANKKIYGKYYLTKENVLGRTVFSLHEHLNLAAHCYDPSEMVEIDPESIFKDLSNK